MSEYSPIDISLSLLRPTVKTLPEQLADRVRMVLNTRPGRLPYQPEFGCDLEGLVGGNATQQRLSEAKLRIKSAIQRWIPDASIAVCEVRLSDTTGHTETDPWVPTAEKVLGSGGVSAVLDIYLVLETPEGPVTLQAQMTP